MSNSKVNELQRLEQGLFQVNNVILRTQEIVLRRFNVSAVEVDILQLLDIDGEKKMKDIGENVHVKLSNLTNIVDRMETQKLVKRVNSKEDRRSIFVHITNKGRDLLNKYNDYLREVSSRMKSAVQDEEFKALISGLEKIAQVELP
ncbi:MAG: MarR family winged helix-turn-helix transcriptional regulator [Bacteroidia bacterium]